MPVASWMSPPGRWGGGANADALNATRSTLLTALGALALAGSLLFTGRTHGLARRGQHSERFAAGVKLISSDRLEEQLGGIYSMEQLMLESALQHEAVVSVLAGFVRARTRIRWSLDDSPVEGVAVRDGERAPWRLPPEVQAALTVLGRRPRRNEQFPVDLSRSDLRGADLRKALFDRADFERAWCEGAKFEGASLVGAKLDFAFIARAHLVGVNLSGASLRGTQMESAVVEDSSLAGADLFKTNFQSATLRRVDMRGAKFNPYATDAQFSTADLRGARVIVGRLEPIDIFESIDLRDAQLVGSAADYTARVEDFLNGARTDGAVRTQDV